MALARDGTLQIGLRPRQVPEPQRDGRLRRALARRRAVYRAREPAPLRRRPSAPSIGPIHYEVLEPLRTRALRPRAATPASRSPSTGSSRRGARPSWRSARTCARGYRLSRRSWCATTRPASRRAGWRSTGSRTEITPETPGSRRATTPGVCATTSASRPATSSPPTPSQAALTMIWCPVLMERPDGRATRSSCTSPGIVSRPGFEQKTVTARDRAPRRTLREVDRDIAPALRFDPSNRRLRGGRLVCTLADGEQRPLEIEQCRRHRRPARSRALLRLRRTPPRRVAGSAPRRRRARRGLLDARAGAPPAPDPRHGRARARPAGRRQGLGQLPADHHGRASRARALRRELVPVEETGAHDRSLHVTAIRRRDLAGRPCRLAPASASPS